MGPGDLSALLKTIPTRDDENLIVGYDSSDDASVYKLSDDIAVIQTIDFFPSMVEDPYLFGQIAATNALSDVYAMGGEVISALNIVTYPSGDDYDLLGEILRGGASKVHEAGASLSGGHSIHDDTIKYGLSVNGRVHPDRIIRNDGARVGDILILTKPIGVGIVTTGYKKGKLSQEAFDEACHWMTTLNKHVADVMKHHPITSATDVTGFGLLGHIKEMLGERVSAEIKAEQVPYIKEAYSGAEQALTTGGGKRNRAFLAEHLDFQIDDLAMEEVLLDPQTSGGLVISIDEEHSQAFLDELAEKDIFARAIGQVTDRQDKTIIIN
ncbi:selenide, water dikinase SelD [Dolosigranulum pigrum]|uniref:selenide, water dikinase SelD n=1 Tax=Dolosigranulum pigrum TaxID=29394 RepID=UPI00283AB015|nr:selenide, water dikinase SelD [Dolosigranulum pigrum]